MLPHYLALNLPLEATDDEIRERYLLLVRQYPPEKEPERFRQLTEAFESLKSARARVNSRLFGILNLHDAGKAIRLLDPSFNVTRRRAGLTDMLSMANKLPLK